MGWLNINGNWIGRHSGKSWQTYWNARKPYFTIDNTGNVEALTDAQIPITLTDADVDIASIETDGSNLFFYTYGDVFVHSYINYLTATTCECYIKISCAALSTLYVGLKLQNHANLNDYSGVMLRRTAHTSTNMLYSCADEHDSLAVGPDVSLLGGASVLSTKFGNVFNFDGVNKYATLDIIKTIPTYGGFGFNFVFPDNTIFDGNNHSIFFKNWDNNNLLQFDVRSTTYYLIYYRFAGQPLGTWASAITPEIGKIHSFYCRWTKRSTVIYLDGVPIIDTLYKIPASPANTAPLCLGSYNGTLQMTKCYIYDIEYNNASLPTSSLRSLNENVSVFHKTQTEKINFISHLPSAITTAYWGEGTIFVESDVIKVYHQKSYSDADLTAAHNIFCLSESSDWGTTWTTTTLMGYGTSVENTVGIYQPFVIKDAGKWYVIFRRHNGTTLIIRESNDGLNFTNPQTFLADTYGTTYNCSVINDNGTFKGLVDVGVTINGFASYVQYYISGATLLTMSYGDLQSTIGTRSPYNYGAARLNKIDNKYYCWTGQSYTVKKALLPTTIYFSESDDPSANEWTTNSTNVLDLDSIYADDQMQDFSITEYNNKVYLIANKNNNTIITCIMGLYKYEGTLAQFIKDITVTHSGL